MTGGDPARPSADPIAAPVALSPRAGPPRPGWSRTFGWLAIAWLPCWALHCGGSLSADDDPRTLELRGLPHCPPGQVYARPVVVRVDRERSLFEPPWSTRVRVASPPVGSSAVEATVPRRLSRALIRVGLCRPNVQATWDCEAPQWLGERSIVLDRRQRPQPVELPNVSAPCRR